MRQGKIVMHSIRSNFLYNVTYQLLLILLPLITTPYISRVLGADGIGTYSYTYTVANYFVLVAMLGVKNYGNRSIAAVRDDRRRLSRTFWQIYVLQFWCALAACAGYFCYILLFERQYACIALLQGIYVFSGFFDISWFFFGLEEFRLTVLRNIVIRLADLACIFLLVRTRDDLWKYTLIMALGVLLSQGYLWLYLRRFVGWYRPRGREMARHLRAELLLFIPVIAVSIYKMMDKVMLGRMSTITQVGYYESVEKIINIPLGVITALGTVMLPRMSNLAAKGQTKKSRRYIYDSMRFAMLLATGMCFGLAGIAQDLIPLFLGEEYLPCILLLQTMAPTVLFIAWANVIRTQYLIPNRLDRSYIISVTLGAVLNLAVNLLLIPRLDALGAVIGTLCAEGSVCLCQTLMVRRQLDVKRYARVTLPFLLPGAGMFLLVRLIGRRMSGPAALVLEITAGAAAYLAVTGAYLLAIHGPAAARLARKVKRKGK